MSKKYTLFKPILNWPQKLTSLEVKSHTSFKAHVKINGNKKRVHVQMSFLLLSIS